ncbi:anthranilate synthase component I [Polynucleobacter paneuropaeus]|nr:anthranilate synthase component I [Polynucleobacter paneuropaeus]
MQLDEFNALAKQGFNRIPLVKEVLADLETPLSLYVKLTQAFGKKNTYLLESVVGGERFGRFSFIGLPAKTLLRTAGTPTAPLTEILTDGKVVESNRDNPLDFIDAYFKRFKVPLQTGLPRFCGGLAGYFGYDTVRYIEAKLASHNLPDELGVPDIQLMLTEELAVIDNVTGKIYFIVYADPTEPNGFEKAQVRLKELLACLSKPFSMPISRPSNKTDLVRNFKAADFEKAVLKTKEYILAGDCMQVVIGQRISKPFTDSPLALYRALRSLNPSPYMYYYDFGDLQVVGSSPEILVRQELRGGEKMVTIRPLAGTRPRGSTPQEDERLAKELLADPKEIAEHVMLIDLARNDVGRIAKTGSVQVTDSMSIEKYSHVQHIVSSVEGQLLDNMSNMDVLRATFPAGTLSGAPKIRAMEIIDEMEVVKRGVYGGAVGYLSFSGDMDVAIAIRTGVIRNGVLHSQAGAGVVADSDPTAEWKETEAKASAVLLAADLVQGGLDAPHD